MSRSIVRRCNKSAVSHAFEYLIVNQGVSKAANLLQWKSERITSCKSFSFYYKEHFYIKPVLHQTNSQGSVLLTKKSTQTHSLLLAVLSALSHGAPITIATTHNLMSMWHFPIIPI